MDLYPLKAENEGLYGYKNQYGNWEITPQFQYATEFFEQFSIVKSKGNFYLINKLGQFVYSAPSDTAFFDQNSHTFFLFQSGSWNVLSKGLTPLVEFSAPKHIQIELLNGSRYQVQSDQGKILMDLSSGKALTSFFKSIENFGETPSGTPIYRIQNKDALFGIIDAGLNELLHCQYKYIEPFNGKYARFEHNGNWGFIDEYGKQLLYKQGFDFVQLIGNDLAEVRRNKRSSWVNLNQPDQLQAGFFDFVLGSTEQSVIVANYSRPNRQGDIQYALADLNGNLITKFQFSRIEKSNKNSYKAKTLEGNWALLSEKGNFSILKNEEWEVLKRYEYFEPFDQNGLSRVSKGVKWGMVNKKGEVVIPIDYDLVQFLGEDRYKTRRRGLERMVNASNRPVGTELYSDISEFSEGLSRVAKKINGEFKFGYINKNSELIIPFIFDQASSFENGKAKVRKDGKWGLVNQGGDVSM